MLLTKVILWRLMEEKGNNTWYVWVWDEGGDFKHWRWRVVLLIYRTINNQVLPFHLMSTRRVMKGLHPILFWWYDTRARLWQVRKRSNTTIQRRRPLMADALASLTWSCPPTTVSSSCLPLRMTKCFVRPASSVGKELYSGFRGHPFKELFPDTERQNLAGPRKWRLKAGGNPGWL